MGCNATVVWDDDYLKYDFGDHPMNPLRLEYTISLARELGVLDDVALVMPSVATSSELLTVHDGGYLQAVRDAGNNRLYVLCVDVRP